MREVLHTLAADELLWRDECRRDAGGEHREARVQAAAVEQRHPGEDVTSVIRTQGLPAPERQPADRDEDDDPDRQEERRAPHSEPTVTS